MGSPRKRDAAFPTSSVEWGFPLSPSDPGTECPALRMGTPTPRVILGTRVAQTSASPRALAGRSSRGCQAGFVLPEGSAGSRADREQPTQPLLARFCARPTPPPRPRPALALPLGDIQTGEALVSPLDQWEAATAEARAARGGAGAGFAPHLVLEEAAGGDPIPRVSPRLLSQRRRHSRSPAATSARAWTRRRPNAWFPSAICAQAFIPTFSSRPPLASPARTCHRRVPGHVQGLGSFRG